MEVPLSALVRGPAIVIFNGQSYYTQEGIKRGFKRKTFRPKSDSFGDRGPRLISQTEVLSLTPVGQLGASLVKYYPYAVTDIGKKLATFALVIHTHAGQTITYSRACITKMPPLHLGAGKPIFGAMEFTILGKAATQPSAADYWKTVAATAFSDATYDETKIITEGYVGAWGETSPYDSLGAMEGFDIEPTMTVSEHPVDGLGVVEIDLEDLAVSASWAPSNLSEAQIDTLYALQGADAVLPGQSLSKAGNDLIITGDSLVATVHNAGPEDADYLHAKGKQRFEKIVLQGARTGTSDPLWTFEVQS